MNPENGDINNENTNVSSEEVINNGKVGLEEQKAEEAINEMKQFVEDNKKPDKKSKKGLIITIIIIVLIILLAVAYLLFGKDLFNKNSKNAKTNNTKVEQKLLPYRIKGNSLELFDLRFLQLENEEVNKVYSPLSIKTALGMLNEGTDGASHEQIASIIGEYSPKKYVNSENMSFANAFFIRDTFKDTVDASYVSTLANKYGAEVLYDSFTTANNLNKWVGSKTFNLIDNLFDDVSQNDFMLVNALAIDMEWVNKIQNEDKEYDIKFAHENYYKYIAEFKASGYSPLQFANQQNASSVELGAVANKYDIVNELGESNIRSTVSKAYSQWLAKDECGTAASEPDVNTYVDQYIKDINSNYKHVSSSTDFYFFDDENIKTIAKDLKQYNGTTLQYIGIMPKNTQLKDYISSLDEKKVNEIINNLKTIELNSFKDGVVTEIKAFIPMFKMDYELKLMDDLKSLGITDVFESDKADLSKLTSSKGVYISDASHKANIEFSNDGIKAAAATSVGGKGSMDCKFDYKYDVPQETIDLTFNNPYLFFIRDKESGEVWFTGTVYEPVTYTEPTEDMMR